MARNAHTPCDEPGCARSPARGDALFRVNPKGEAGIFMCKEHEAATWSDPRSGNGIVPWPAEPANRPNA